MLNLIYQTRIPLPFYISPNRAAQRYSSLARLERNGFGQGLRAGGVPGRATSPRSSVRSSVSIGPFSIMYPKPFPLASPPKPHRLLFHPTSHNYREFGSGDLVCDGCGLVLGGRVVNTRSEWRVRALTQPMEAQPFLRPLQMMKAMTLLVSVLHPTLLRRVGPARHRHQL